MKKWIVSIVAGLLFLVVVGIYHGVESNAERQARYQEMRTYCSMLGAHMTINRGVSAEAGLEITKACLRENGFPV